MVIHKIREHFFITKKAVSVITLLFIGFLLCNPGKVYGENTALTFFKNYTSDDYRLQPQNWDILQDKRGIIYVANQSGLLEFDGVSWKEIPVHNKTARSIAVDHDGTVYVGGNNEIGFLAPGVRADSKPGVRVDSRAGVRVDSRAGVSTNPESGIRENTQPIFTGSLKYTSLLPYFPVSRKNFGPVWRTHSTPEGIFFWTSRYLFCWDPKAKKIKSWKTESVYTASFSYNGHLYLRQKKTGLMKMKNGALVLVPGGEIFAEQNTHAMIPFVGGKLLVGNRSMGFFLFDGYSMNPFPAPAFDYIRQKRLYFGTRLSNGDFALATRLGGLVIMDVHGNLKNIIDKTSGLPGNSVRYVFQDRQGNVWLALDSGITKIEYNSPFTIYDNKRSNLPGIALSVARHGPHRTIFAGTTSGCYSMTPGGKFIPVPGISGTCWALLATGESLMAATGRGIFHVNGKKSKQIIESSSFVLSQSLKDINRIWAGTRWGLVSLYLEKETKQWIRENTFEKVSGKIGTIVENKDGNLWLGTGTGNVINVKFPGDRNISEPSVTRYGHKQGLPSGEVHVFWAAECVMFATEKGIYRFDKEKEDFVPDPVFGKEFADGSRSVFRIAEDSNKNTWFHSKRRNFQAIPRADGTYMINETPFLRLPPAQVNAIYSEPGGEIIWFAGHKGLVRYDTTVKKTYRHDFPALIRGVWFNGVPNNSSTRCPVIEYEDRNIRFQYSAIFFENESATRYQCLLEGYDYDWTPWNKEIKKDYTNLDPGLYTFRVRAKNVYNVVSREAVSQFKILPPWYRTWWAYTIYALGFLMLMFLSAKWRSKLHEKEKLALEKVVKARTKEIEEQKRQLEKQTGLLAEQSEKLKEMDKVKSRFFANISHEFRTPITLIMGPLEQMLSCCSDYDRDQKKKLKMMLHNCRRLLRLINQLLELSNFESGTMKLQSRPRNIIHFLKGIVDSFDIFADQEELDLMFYTREENITLYIDDRKMENAISNLLINAMKFTPAGGRITVTCTEDPLIEKDFPSGSVRISVSDTGPGIPEERLAGIFERFYQSESTYEHHSKGFGIGLAIAKELVELHHGTIDVNSKKNHGTEFIIRLPLGKSHLSPNEIIDSGDPTYLPYTHAIPARRDFSEQADAAPDNITFSPEANNGESGEEQSQKDIILVVEDSIDMRNYIKDSLEPGYRVIEAMNGRDGVEKANKFIPDLVISDIMMPETDGYELCRLLKSNRDTSHIPIVLLTAKAAEENIIEGLETGADDYITKPFNTKILCARIKNLIQIRARLQQNIKQEMTLQPVKMPVSDIDKEFLNDLLAVLETNISDPEFSVDELSNKLYMGRTTLYRKIHALSGETAKEFIRSYRLKRAAELLKKTSASILEISMEVGFSSSSYFAKCFKEKFNQLPSEYQTTAMK